MHPKSMRTIAEIQHRKSRRDGGCQILDLALANPNTALLEKLTGLYNKATWQAVNHAPVGHSLLEIEDCLWLMESDLDIRKYAWFQFGVPRLRVVAAEFDLPWDSNNKVLVKMSHGDPCSPSCFHCLVEHEKT
jgi:hypothetical protein